jgi:hypothetical protein
MTIDILLSSAVLAALLRKVIRFNHRMMPAGIAECELAYEQTAAEAASA